MLWYVMICYDMKFYILYSYDMYEYDNYGLIWYEYNFQIGTCRIGISFGDKWFTYITLRAKTDLYSCAIYGVVM